MKNIIKFSPAPLPTQESLQDDIAKDALELFTFKKQGHMERWEYGPSLTKDDPAGGGEYWADLVKNPGNYYLTKGDVETIHWSLKQAEFLKVLQEIETVVELGPGSNDAIEKKTIPFLRSCEKLKNYIAIDATLEQATDAARNVQKFLSISTGVRSQDYMNTPLVPAGQNKTAVVMWGSSLGNIDGFFGENPFQKLLSNLENFKSGLKQGDLIILCFDTETDAQKVKLAYSEPSLHSQILSILYRLQRDGYTSGLFNPDFWRHEAIWNNKSYQCSHAIYPIADQDFVLENTRIKVPAWTKFISNNSYKFKPETIERASTISGLTPRACLQIGPIALLVAEKN